ncbi:MAG: sigma-70 family RNA polymerase sigma factor [Clostridia bacterium]|nr:sigma-70 family RNA polymerase sigma factor [Clostridia bacterium]
MEKKKADIIITEYLQKIYGFAYKKSFSYDETEELASEMTSEVYKSLLAAEDIYNIEGYVWRICEHTYARYVASVKRNEGVSIDSVGDIAYHERFDTGEADEELIRLRREIAFLSALRRDIVFRFYYKDESIREIASRLGLPEGTVKWHLNKARNELKEGLKMERKIGSLGINPVKAVNYGHNGSVGRTGGPEYYLGDSISLNIVYSVYYEPKNLEEIAEELGVTPVFIQDKAEVLENNGFLVRQKDGRFTTYVEFSPLTRSKEELDRTFQKKLNAAKVLAKEYVPLVRKAIVDAECYIPGGNRELLDAAAILYAVTEKCSLRSTNNAGGADDGKLNKYYLMNLDGGRYIAYVDLASEWSDPDYKPFVKDNYAACGSMNRWSVKYPNVQSWSIDSRFDSRMGCWANNLTADYDYLYEYMTGRLSDKQMNADKIGRLKKRGFIGENGEVLITVCKEDGKSFFKRIPVLADEIKERFAPDALDIATQAAKSYPPQMYDLIVAENSDFLDRTVGMMVLDILYADGTFKPLTEKEKVAANLIMFSDVLPE